MEAQVTVTNEVSRARIMTVVGARPNFMKAAPIIAAMEQHNRRVEAAATSTFWRNGHRTLASILVHTGQHYDEAMSGRFFADLKIPKPDVHLGAGSGSHATQTAEIMKRFEEVLLRERPDVLIVAGDVNSTLACALVAAKISYDCHGSRPLIVHVEAGLRSGDRSMPEEVNRILTDHLADLLFVTEESGVRNLEHEGVPKHKIHLVGNTMIDSLLACREQARLSPILEQLGLIDSESGERSRESARVYALLTLHRPSNVDSRAGFLAILEGLQELSHQCPIIFPAHPRTQKQIAAFGYERFFCRREAHRQSGESPRPRANEKITLIEPLGYLDFLCLMDHAALVVTDSGGIQEETTSLGVSCVTVRDNTERPVTLQVGTNILAGTTAHGIRAAIRQQMREVKQGALPKGWDGRSAERILHVICEQLSEQPVQTCAPPEPNFATVQSTTRSLA
jgi:UDP-N-acetylglucosamine 2-epimerase (non-hydrolysing)